MNQTASQRLNLSVFVYWLLLHCCSLRCVFSFSWSVANKQLSMSALKQTKKVAVIGGGFAGLATAYKLSEIASCLDIFDFKPPGQAGASAAAGGLLHPLSPRGGFIWHGLEGYSASKQLLTELTQRAEVQKLLQDEGGLLFDMPSQGILRPVFKAADIVTWRTSSSQHTDWIEELHNANDYKNWNSNAVGAFRIKQGIVVNSPLYLKALWTSIQGNTPDSNWLQMPIQSVDYVQKLAQHYDVVIIAAGAGLQQLWTKKGDSKHQFVVKYVKGENIFYPNDDPDNALTQPLLSGEYIVPRTKKSPNEKDYLLCGATHDHLAIAPDRLVSTMQGIGQGQSSAMAAQSALRLKLEALYPQLVGKEPFGYNAGIRLVTERTNLGKLPIVGRHPAMSNVWAVAGLGARGLVYHAAMAAYLQQAIASDDETCIPSVLHPTAHY